jgi:hypothetical protein
MRTLTKAERRVRKAKIYSTYEGAEAWYYIGKGTSDFYLHVADGTVVRMTVGTREIRGALKQMDKELDEQKDFKPLRKCYCLFCSAGEPHKCQRLPTIYPLDEEGD